MSIRFRPDDRRLSRSVLAAATVLAGALALSGCSAEAHVQADGSGGTTPATSAPTTSASSSVAPSTSATTSSASSSAGSAASSGSYRSSRCLASALKGTIGDGEGAAGSTVVQLVLRNTGSSPCTLQGWPGVSFIDANGHQVGAAAVLDRSSVHQTVTLTAGGSAQAALKIAQAENFPKSACAPETVHRLRVYPPGSTASIVVDTSAMSACTKTAAGQLNVQAFVPAS